MNSACQVSVKGVFSSFLCGLVLLVGAMMWPVFSLQAKESVTFHFYYPGGEGSQEEAAPLMAQFASEVSALSQMPVKAQYTAVRTPIKTLVKNAASTLVLLRLDSYLDEVARGVSLEPVLMSQPIEGNGTTLEVSGTTSIYQIYGAKRAAPAEDPKARCAVIELGVDVSAAFVVELFGSAFQGIPVSPTNVPLERLEMIARGPQAGTKPTCIMLEERQWQALQKIPFPWKESLERVGLSVPILSPVVVSIGKPSPAVLHVVEALKKMGAAEQSSEAREILSDLEMVKFRDLTPEDRHLLTGWKSRRMGLPQGAAARDAGLPKSR